MKKKFLSYIYTQKQKFKNINIYYCVIFLNILTLCIFLRFYNIENWNFTPDLGTEFTVVDFIISGKAYPLVGPEIGARNFLSPPTYFYLLTFFTLLAGNIQNVVFFFALNNTFAVLVLTFLIKKMTTTKIALIFFLFLSVNTYFLYEARNIWHPHPLTLFLSLSLLFLYTAQNSKKIYKLIIGVFFYFFALSIYISPIVFLPWIIRNVFVWFLKKKKSFHNITISGFKTLLILFLTSFPIYLSQIIYELLSGFPTFNSLFLNKQPFLYDSLATFLKSLYMNIYTFSQIIFGNIYTYSYKNYFLLSVFLLSISLFTAQLLSKDLLKNTKFKKKLDFFWFPYSFLFSFMIFMIFNPTKSELSEHRFLPFLIYFFLFLSLSFYQNTEKRKEKLYYVCGFVFFVLFISNTYMSRNLVIFSNNSTHNLKKMKSVVQLIKSDSDRNNININKIVLLANDAYDFRKVELNFMQLQYEVMSYQYLFYKEAGYPIQLDRDKNQLLFKTPYILDSKPYVYIICHNEQEIEKCAPYIAKNFKYSLIKRGSWYPDITIFLLKKGT